MIIDHAKAKAAIEADPGDPSYNLTGTGPEALDNNTIVNAKFPNLVSFASGLG